MKRKKPTALITAVLTLITILFWTGFEIYRSLTIKPAPQVPQEIINPLDPTLDTKTLDSLEGRTFLDDSQIGNNVAAPTPTPLPVFTSVTTSSTSATPSIKP